MKKIIFRADGNRESGLGHLYRLFSLVESVKNTFDYIFLTKDTSLTSIIPKEYYCSYIPAKISLEDEPLWMSNKFSSDEHIIIADGYHFNSNYQKKIKSLGYKLIYIDDLAEEYMFADVVINHSPQLKKEDFKSANYTRFALGIKYAMLRPKFLENARKQRQICNIDVAFVCFGGADRYNLSYKFTEALLRLGRFKKINIVIGAANTNKDILSLQKKNRDTVMVYKNLQEQEIIQLMKSCNFAVVPSSTVLFEIFCIKMPVYSGYFVNNQKEAYNFFRAQNLVGGEGNFIKENLKDIEKKLETFINNCHISNILENQSKLIDGNQNERHKQIIKAVIR